MLLSLLVAAQADDLYYGTENDPDHSSAADKWEKALEKANPGSDLEHKENRGGRQILADLDALVASNGEDGQLDCEDGVFVFHYSGHGMSRPSTATWST